MTPKELVWRRRHRPVSTCRLPDVTHSYLGVPRWTSQLGCPHGGRLRAEVSQPGPRPLFCSLDPPT